MFSLFNNPPVVQYQDMVEFEKGEDAMGYYDGRPVLQETVKMSDNFVFRLGIYCAEAIVENDEAGIFYERPGN
jgi:hypothetical protein